MRQNQREDEVDHRGPAVIVPKITLPTAKTPVSTTLASRIMLWHGDPKIGKTVQANSARGGTFFLKFEPGHDHIEHLGNTINTWQEMIGNVNALEEARRSKETLSFSNVCVDTCGMAFLRCTEFVLAQLDIIHESDAMYGKGSQMIEREFRRQITRLCNLGFGVIMIAHSTDKTMTNGKSGMQKKEWTKRCVDLPKKGEAVVPPLADLILFFTKQYDEKNDSWERVIKTQRTDAYDAGMRYPEGWEPLPDSIPMSYDALEQAWNAGAPSAAVARIEEARLAKERAEQEAAELEALKAEYSSWRTLVGPEKARAVLGKAPEATQEGLKAAIAKLRAAHEMRIDHQSQSKEASRGTESVPPPDPQPSSGSPPETPLKLVSEASEQKPQPGPSANENREAAQTSKAPDTSTATEARPLAQGRTVSKADLSAILRRMRVNTKNLGQAIENAVGRKCTIDDLDPDETVRLADYLETRERDVKDRVSASMGDDRRSQT